MIVVTDTSVALNLCWLKQDSLIAAIYQEVLAPRRVQIEFDRKAATDARFVGLRFPPFITLADPQKIPAFIAHNPALDAGEIAAIALALEQGIPIALIDEKAARAAAVALDLQVTGVLGVLIEGKRRGLIPALAPLLDLLAHGAKFWIDPRLRQRVLAAAGETS